MLVTEEVMMTGDKSIRATLPSFSIILETENLTNADIEGLSKSLASLLNQDISPTCANEVLLIDSGDVSAELLEQLCDRYPWIKIHSAPPDTGYYKAKMLGAQVATGEILVYCDSDCIYEPHWLGTLLATFCQKEHIQIVAGETTTRGVGPYGTAMALTYIFPQYSGEQAPTPTTQYFLNNVAFRRQFLLDNPIPIDLPLYRGNCAIHAHELLQTGYTIWKQPQARATHAPPNGLSHFFWRFLLIGHDYYWQNRLLAKPNSEIGNQKNLAVSFPGDLPNAATGSQSIAGQGKMQIFFERIGRMVKNDPRHRIYLPFAIPIALTSVTLIFVGYLLTSIQPNLLLKVYDRVLESSLG
ncbi:glycosyltransferase family 2 protein [Kovacikia minuta CCNUW1]|uniref:glycosyltransferase n=1 Tax=Kovacikia minuta TaxID=2931930 RepID=UPI001CCAB2AB|nr:glycosyltransferase family A protein [Kovacikia minuta]UBF23858.1 glycosyltransferase family 2 protein [Kovacikia minuta CCNUW1]